MDTQSPEENFPSPLTMTDDTDSITANPNNHNNLINSSIPVRSTTQESQTK